MKYWLPVLLTLLLGTHFSAVATDKESYQLSQLKINSNLLFENSMYSQVECDKKTSKTNHPGNFSNIYEVSSFYTPNHVWVETPCVPEKDGKTVGRWEQKIISFDSMNDRDKELYLRLLNTVFLNAKMNHTQWNLPDNMSRHKLEHIVTGISSFATRQLSIPNVNTQIKQTLEKSERTVSKYNLKIMTELAYIENLLMGTTPKVIDRWDGVFYAIPNMSQKFMDFLSTADYEGNQFITTEQINSFLAITDQLNKLSVVEVEESIDYAQVQGKFVSYFKNTKTWEKFRWKLLELSTENQYTLLKYFDMWAEELWEDAGRRDKHFLALWLYDIFEMVNRKEWGAVWMLETFIKDFPQFKDHEIGKSVDLLAADADSVDTSWNNWSEQRLIELAKIKKENQLLVEKQRDAKERQRDAKERQRIYDKLNWVLSKGVGVKNK